MPSIKIYPPSQLPNKALTETHFNIWKEELEVYLSQEKGFKVFLPGQLYDEWDSAESYANRIRNLHANDVIINDRRTAPQLERDNEEKLSDIRVNLRTVLAIVGKCVSEGHYNTVVRHSTSLQWIYNTIRADYNIQSKGIHFFNVIDAKYDPSKHTPVGFYNEYRTIIMNNLAKQGDVIKYKNNENMLNDEKMSPTLEDIVLLDAIKEINPKLPSIVRSHYNHKIKADERLMDFKADILVNIPLFLAEIQNAETDIEGEASLNAFKRLPFKKNTKTKTTPQYYCRLCWLAKMPRDIYISHNLGDSKCSQLSFQDRKKLKESLQLNVIKTESHDENSEEDISSQFGYHADRIDTGFDQEEVIAKNFTSHDIDFFNRIEKPSFNYIKPVSSQILTVFKDRNNKIPLHIELDSGASINFCEEKAALHHGFKIDHNKQVSKLGDGETIIKSVGEINELFYRNDWSIRYRAVVCKKLSSPFIGGTVFLQDNNMEQDFANNTIKLFNRSITVQPTDPLSLLPTAPVETKNEKVFKKNKAKFLTFNSKWLLPNQDVYVDVPDSLKQEQLLAVQSCERNKNHKWPLSELKEVKNGKINLVNTSDHPIHLGNEVKRCTLFPLEKPEPQKSEYYDYRPQILSLKDEDATSSIKIDHISCPEAKKLIKEAHVLYKDTFNQDLTNGYNNFYGNHLCSLNWASSERPTASKVHVPSYDHDLKVLQQEVMDDLTDQNVLLIPQEHGKFKQYVPVSFRGSRGPKTYPKASSPKMTFAY